MEITVIWDETLYSVLHA